MLFFTAGVPLLALLAKGNDQVVPEGSIEVIYLNGPLRISRKAMMALQPTLASDRAYVYLSESVRYFRNPRKDMYSPKLFCGQRLVSDSHPLRLELRPGNYWFSTEEKKEGSIRVELLPRHEYFIGIHRHRLVLNEIKPKKKRVYPHQLVDEDLTKLTSEEYRSLTAEPAIKGNESRTQNK